MTDEQINDLAMRYAGIISTGRGLHEFARAVAAAAVAAERERRLAELKNYVVPADIRARSKA